MIHKSTSILMILTLVGCSSPSDERIEQLAQQSLHAQAEQNRHIADQSREVAEASRRLVEADAQARQEVIQLQRELAERDAQGRAELDDLVRQTHADIRADERYLDQQRQDFELERRHIARARQREPIIAEAITGFGLVLAALLPLLLCAYVLYTVNRAGDDDALVGQLLVQELTAEQPLLLPPPGSPPVIHHRSAAEEPPPQVDDG